MRIQCVISKFPESELCDLPNANRVLHYLRSEVFEINTLWKELKPDDFSSKVAERHEELARPSSYKSFPGSHASASTSSQHFDLDDLFDKDDDQVDLMVVYPELYVVDPEPKKRRRRKQPL